MKLRTIGDPHKLVTNHYKSILLNGMIDYWKMDETGDGSQVRLDSVGSRTLTPTNGLIQSASGKKGQSASFPGGGTLYMRASDASLQAVNWSAGFSIAAWFYIPAPLGSSFSIMSKGESAQDWVLYYFGPTSMRMNVVDSSTGASLCMLTVSAVQPDTWNFIGGRYNPSTHKSEVRLNASSWGVAGSSISNGPKNNQTVLCVCRNTNNYGKNNLDEVGLWSRYLSDAEYDKLYNGGAGLTYPFLGVS